MNISKLKLITIVAESILEEPLVAKLKELGARGYTAVASRGSGSRDLRSGEIPGENVRIESIVSQKVAEQIMEHLSENYFQNYAVICYVSEVGVLRGEKYV